jgi:hypothetical protein
MDSQTPASALDAAGYLRRISVERVLDEDANERVDVEAILTRESQAGLSDFAVRFVGCRDIKIGDGHDGIDLYSYFLLSVWDVSRDGWDGVRYRAANLEQSCPFSLYCRSFEVPSA